MIEKLLRIQLFLLSLLLMMLIVSCSPKPYVVVENYNVTAPYNITEEYKEKVPYQVESCHTGEYDSEGGFLRTSGYIYEKWIQCTNIWMGHCVMTIEPLYYSDQPDVRVHDDEDKIYIKNNEYIDGIFKIVVEYYNESGVWLAKDQYDIINVTGNNIFVTYLNYTKLHQKMNSARYFTLSLIKPIKRECYNVTKYEYINKERIVIKYKEVEKQRNITIYK